jgi:hypothetical protein
VSDRKFNLREFLGPDQSVADQAEYGHPDDIRTFMAMVIVMAGGMAAFATRCEQLKVDSTGQALTALATAFDGLDSPGDIQVLRAAFDVMCARIRALGGIEE